MYNQFFGLRHSPFSIAPDPHYLFMSERHREALAHLLFGLQSGGGFVLLTGEIGAGKTTVCRLFLEQIPPKCNVAYIFNPKQTVLELLRSICEEFGIDTAGLDASTATVKDFIDPLNIYLLATHAVHQNNVLIIDEAQNLSADVLEQLRLLTNLETNERKLLQIVLIGQPELRTMLAQPELEQLAQRVIARFHLQALSLDETSQYIAHRLGVAGNTGAVPFTKRAVRLVHRRARGIPRRINVLCDRALLAAYAQGKREIDTAMIGLAAREVFDLDSPGGTSVAASPSSSAKRQWRSFAIGLAVVTMVIGGAVVALQSGALRTMSTLPLAVLDRPANASRAVVPVIDKAKEKSVTAAILPPSNAALLAASASPIGAENLTAAGTVASTTASTASNTTSNTTSNTASNITNASIGPSGPMPAVGTETRDLADAYRKLGRFWQLTLSGNDPCTAASEANVYCFRSNKGLAEIRQLDRPGVLTLYDDAHKNYYVLLRGLSADQALLQIGDQLQAVSLNALAHRWEGEFATLWRGPAGARRGINTNERGAAVNWLVGRLALAKGQGASAQSAAPTAVFDAALSMQVREFQLAQGLLPDGLAGPQTLMQLASLTDPAEPHLQTMNAATRNWVSK